MLWSFININDKHDEGSLKRNLILKGMFFILTDLSATSIYPICGYQLKAGAARKPEFCQRSCLAALTAKKESRFLGVTLLPQLVPPEFQFKYRISIFNSDN